MVVWILKIVSEYLVAEGLTNVPTKSEQDVVKTIVLVSTMDEKCV